MLSGSPERVVEATVTFKVTVPDRSRAAAGVGSREDASSATAATITHCTAFESAMFTSGYIRSLT
jgi:hypothetical protein